MSSHISIINLERVRGDDFPPQYQLVDSAGAGVDISGYSFKFAVNTEEDPVDEVNEVFRLTGTITDAPNGLFQFNGTTIDWDLTPGGTPEYFYEVEMTDASSKIRTIIKGTITVEQDKIKT